MIAHETIELFFSTIDDPFLAAACFGELANYEPLNETVTLKRLFDPFFLTTESIEDHIEGHSILDKLSEVVADLNFQKSKAISAIIPLLKHDDPAIVMLGIDWLGDTRDEQAIPYLRPFLSYKNIFRKWRKYGKLPSNIIRLLEVYEIGLCLNAIYALGKIGHSESFDLLIPLLKKENPSRLRQAAVKALGQIGKLAIIPHLRLLLKDGDVIVSLTAASTLMNLGEPVSFWNELLNNNRMNK